MLMNLLWHFVLYSGMHENLNRLRHIFMTSVEYDKLNGSNNVGDNQMLHNNWDSFVKSISWISISNIKTFASTRRGRIVMIQLHQPRDKEWYQKVSILYCWITCEGGISFSENIVHVGMYTFTSGKYRKTIQTAYSKCWTDCQKKWYHNLQFISIQTLVSILPGEMVYLARLRPGEIMTLWAIESGRLGRFKSGNSLILNLGLHVDKRLWEC